MQQSGLSKKACSGLLVVGLAATALTLLAGVRAGDKPRCMNGGIVDLELAGSPDRAQKLIGDCETAREKKVLHDALMVDSALFVPLYALILSYWCLVSHRYTPPRTRAARASMVAGAIAAWLAAVFDWLENAALAQVIDSAGNSGGGTALALAASLPKWVLVVYAVLMALTALLCLVRALARTHNGKKDPRHLSKAKDGWERATDLPPPRDPAEPGSDPAELGIAFSGGGIRSASFCMGAIGVLEEQNPQGSAKPFLRRARWITAVSGGAYAAGARQMLARGGVATPFRAGSAEVDHVRRHGRYLADSQVEWLTASARILAGLTLNLGVFWLGLSVLARPLGWLHHYLGEIENKQISEPDALWATVALPAGLAALFVLLAVLARPHADAAVPFSLGGFLWRCSAICGCVAIVTGAIALLAPLADFVAQEVLKHTGKQAAVREAAAGGGVGLLTALVTLARVKAPSRATFERWLCGAKTGSSGSTAPRPARFPRLGRLARGLAGVAIAATTLLLFAGVVQDAAVAGMHGKREVLRLLEMTDWHLVLFAAGILLGLHLFADQTSWSLHSLYKRRLATAFALGPVGNGVAELPYDQPTSLPEMAEKLDDQPELVICAAANVSGSDLAPPGRRAVTFTFGHQWAGGPQVTYIPTSDLSNALRPSLRGDTTLLAAMAISGAAFASAMGRHSKGGLNALMALTNLRLGVWIPSPSYAAEVFQGGRRVRNRSLTYLLREICGAYDPNDRMLYLTDGGHYENLALVELLRRHCKIVACFDASGGPDTLVEAIRLAWEELGATVEFPPGALDSVRTPAELRLDDPNLPPPADLLAARTAESAVIVGTITYRDGEEGTIVYGRAVLTADTPEPVRRYARDHLRFPNDPTGDQWFDVEQFNNYLCLGRHVTEQVVASLPPLSPLTAVAE